MRFAQDDGFWEGTEKHLGGRKKREKIEKSQALGMTIHICVRMRVP
jgi:hypothetical protein